MADACPECGRWSRSGAQCYRCRGRHEYERIAALPVMAVQGRMDELAATPLDDDGFDELRALAAVHGLSPRTLTTEIDQPLLAFLFAGADDAVREALIAILDDPSTPTVGINAVLLRLAYVGGDRVAERLTAWTQEAPFWTQGLFVSPTRYAEEADAEVGDGATWRPLTMPVSIGTRESSGQDAAASIGGRIDERCPRCRARLLIAYAANEADDPLALGGDVRIRVCPICVMDVTGDPLSEVTMHDRYDRHGGGTLEVAGSVEPDADHSDDLLDWDVVWQAAAPVSAWRSRFDAWEVPVIGGHPAWVQDADYIRCPDCAQTMRSLAWIPVSAISQEGDEGVIFLQACTACRVASAVYQQT